jgi:ABC-2 type transport system permease protein
MSTLYRLFLTEARLFVREPMTLLFGLFFPSGLLLILGAVPALREPVPEFDDQRFVEVFAPSALVLGIGVVALQHVPNVIAGYREHGILRRLSTTPVHPGKLLVAQLLVAAVGVVASAALLIGVAWLALDVAPPQHPGGFVLAGLVGFGAMLAIGTLIAAVVPNQRAATGLSTVVYMITMFAGGVFLPRFLMPEVLARAGEIVPPGVQAILDAWSGAAPSPVQLGLMAVVALGAGVAAAKLFRWE